LIPILILSAKLGNSGRGASTGGFSRVAVALVVTRPLLALTAFLLWNVCGMTDDGCCTVRAHREAADLLYAFPCPVLFQRKGRR